jgi:hypothetical protein
VTLLDRRDSRRSIWPDRSPTAGRCRAAFRRCVGELPTSFLSAPRDALREEHDRRRDHRDQGTPAPTQVLTATNQLASTDRLSRPIANKVGRRGGATLSTRHSGSPAYPNRAGGPSSVEVCRSPRGLGLREGNAVECGLIVIPTEHSPHHRRFCRDGIVILRLVRTGFTTVLLITDSSLRFSPSRD